MELLRCITVPWNWASTPKRSESYSLVPQVTSRVGVGGNTVTTDAKPCSDWSARYVLGGVNAHRMGTHRTSLRISFQHSSQRTTGWRLLPTVQVNFSEIRTHNATLLQMCFILLCLFQLIHVDISHKCVVMEDVNCIRAGSGAGRLAAGV